MRDNHLSEENIKKIRRFSNIIEASTYFYDNMDFLSFALSKNFFGVLNEGNNTTFNPKQYDFSNIKKPHDKQCELIFAHKEYAYFTAYVLAAYSLKNNIQGLQILRTISIKDIYEDYEFLHTQSLNYILDYIHEHYERRF